MGKDTTISWCDATFNAWWGCVEVSPGCSNCYARGWDKRTGGDHWGPTKSRRFFSDKHWAEPLKWDAVAQREGRRLRVFCMSMGDVFEDRRDLEEPRERLWELIGATPHLDWLLLTKRPENFSSMLPWMLAKSASPKNVWLGVTVEDQLRAEERIPLLLRARTVVRFLSCEPLLEQIDLRRWLRCDECRWNDEYDDGAALPASMLTNDDHRCGDGEACPLIRWVIIGGESGSKARPFHLSWAKDILAQCRQAGVAPFFKQAGDAPVIEENDDQEATLFQGARRSTQLVQIKPRHRKGEDLEEWPESLRVRSFPGDGGY